ncbi:PREDICTED: protein SIEVE ELEMENT OCCLUSION B-like isoform X1 [Ipomoea nil]|uniref:protein SIEVE ELEMENT OCCLUSION B-like isoform X1 n=1 Tax=Ipomoea nil TaxID=35883 RepID=UPI000900C020|nr:PREDICTED: protein SIEVE ELEMENT OCCLUSION B-like isoform X1 [Ipomoea nil]
MEYQPLTSSDITESIDFKEVMATHDPISKDFKASHILYFVKKIIFLIMMGGKAIYEDEDSDDNVDESNHKVVPDEIELKDIEHWYQIKLLSSEIALKCSENTDDPHSTIMHFLKMLCAYPWEAKILMMLAAFSLNFGELSHLQSHKGLPHKLANLKGISNTPLLTLAPSHIQQSIFLFIKSLLHLTNTIVELAQSSSFNSSPIIPITSYWILISILNLASYFGHFPGGDSEWLNAEGEKLSSLTTTINYLFSAYCHPMLEMKREEDSYNALWCAFSDENLIHRTNLDVLKLIFNVKDVDKEEPLYDSMQDQTAGLRSLENKKLVLFITSDLEIETSMLIASAYLYFSAQLWIPIVDYPTLRWDTETLNHNYRVLAKEVVEICGVKNLEKFIAPGFARFVKKKFFPIFQIGGGPIAVLLDQYGRIVHCTATNMIVKKVIDFALKGGPSIRNKDSIIPFFKNALMETTSSVRHLVFNIDERISDFTNQMDSKLDEWFLDIHSEIQNSLESLLFKDVKEEDGWKEKSWCTKLLIGKNLIPPAEEWVNANEHIFFIGGNAINWVKTFASKILREVQPQGTINMVYVGSSNKVASLIRRDMICETFENIMKESEFWINLQSIFLSRIKFLDDACRDEKSDEIVKGLKLLLAYEAEQIGVVGWALLCKGNKIVVYDLGDKMLAVMNEYAKWKESAMVKGFDQAFKDHHNEMFAGSTSTSQHHPCALECPSNSNKVPENIKCPQCCHNMQKFVTFRCYNDHLFKEFVDAPEDEDALG